MAYTLIASSPANANVRLYLNTTSNTLCYSVNGGNTYINVAGGSSYKSIYTGGQIDSGVGTALNLTNWPILQRISSSGNNYYIDGKQIAIVSAGTIPGVSVQLANGNTAGIVQQSTQISISNGIPSLVTSNVYVPWANVQNKESATASTPGVVQFATTQQAVAGNATNVAITPAQLAANTVKSINNTSGTLVFSGAGGIAITPTTSNGSTTFLVSNTVQGLQPAPANGTQYVQKNGDWAPFTMAGTILSYDFEIGSDTAEGTVISGSSAIFSRAQFGNPTSPPEFDLIDSGGYNISYESKYSYRWDPVTSDYIIICSGGWEPGSYKLKTRGLPGPTYTLSQITDYNQSATYSRGDLVTSGGQVYQALMNANAYASITDPNVWHRVVASGAEGTTPVLSAGAVETLAADDNATVTITGDGSGSYAVDFGIPRGSDGYTPMIGINGNWVINGQDTGVLAGAIVSSVNSKTGEVVLDASDVGAFPVSGGTISNEGDVVVSSGTLVVSLLSVGSSVNDLTTTISSALASI